jgi:glycosidase
MSTRPADRSVRPGRGRSGPRVRGATPSWWRSRTARRARTGVGLTLACLLAVGVTAATANAAELPGPAASSDVLALAGKSLRAAETDERIYNAMTDRFENGDPSNDNGGVLGDRLANGFDPTSKAFYNGGDLKGLTSRLGYIKQLGATAIWITPPMYNDWVQTLGDSSTASYHGYWITKFDQLDPHVGTAQDMKDMVAAAHGMGIKVYFDIVVNHTGDVIRYREGEGLPYIDKATEPYRDASGKPFNDRDYAASPTFPKLDAATSFPYTPYFPNAADATAKSPAWLNDPTMYHNRGETTFTGENSYYGDFFGLDDVFTERPEVRQGFVDIFTKWIADYDIDGYRIDTTRHVNMEFWRAFMDGVLTYARANGKPDFYMFGEAAVADPVELSSYTTDGKYQSVLDFTFQETARQYISEGGSATLMKQFFQTDDMFIDHDSNAYQLPTFVDNHDRGRIAWFIRSDNPGISDGETVRRSELAHDLMYFSRGNPVVYYGDEQGFTGDGNDQDARETMFPSQVASYLDNDLIGTDSTHATSNFNVNHPIFRYIQRLNNLMVAHPALRNGAQITRFADGGPGVFATSRISAEEQIEYVVAVNNAEWERTVDIPTFSKDMAFRKIYAAGNQTLVTDSAGALTITVPPLTAVVYKAAKPLAASAAAPAVKITNLNGARISGRAAIGAAVGDQGFNQVTFAVKVGNANDWTLLGTDDNPDYKVYYDTSKLPNGTRLQFRAVVMDNAGHTRASTAVTQVVGRR